MKTAYFGVLLVASAMLGACEFVGSAVAPSVTGRGGDTTGQPVAIQPLDVSKLGAPSGTSAGALIPRFRSDLAQLQQAAVDQVQRARQLQADMEAAVAGYQIAVSTIRTQQDGIASDDSLATWQRAQAQLRTISATLDQMSGLSSEVAKNVAYAAFLEQSIRAASTARDAVDEDRRQLRVLEDATSQTSASLDQVLDGLRRQVLRESHFLGAEGANLAQMAPPAAGAAAIAGAAPQQSAIVPAPPAGAAGAGLASGRPFVVIPFDDPAVEFEQQLYEAVSAALARSPNVAFDLVAVAPAGGTAEDLAFNSETARSNGQRVMRSLLDMGLPADRISISQVTDPNIQGNEVHLYVR